MAAENRFAAVSQRRSGPTPTPGSSNEETRKYTILMTATLADQLDGDVLALRRRMGRKVDKSQVHRALVELLHDDPTVMDAVARRLAD